MSYSVIITAGGIGKRMASVLPKQFIPIREKPILMYTIERFYHFDPKCQILVTLPEDWMSYWNELLLELDFKIPHRIVPGGGERYDSIKNALSFCYGDFIVVHDGVRPLVNEDTLLRCFNKVKKENAVVPVLQMKESIRQVVEDGTLALDRAQFLIVQTPQCFKKEILLRAYEQPYHASITDDACLVEEYGVDICTVEGNEENIKITTQKDLRYAELLLK
jgi:2-C-methyl-D-erythritol 4-phosphate cytidylyltransferase